MSHTAYATSYDFSPEFPGQHQFLMLSNNPRSPLFEPGTWSWESGRHFNIAAIRPYLGGYFLRCHWKAVGAGTTGFISYARGPGTGLPVVAGIVVFTGGWRWEWEPNGQGGKGADVRYGNGLVLPWTRTDWWIVGQDIAGDTNWPAGRAPFAYYQSGVPKVRFQCGQSLDPQEAAAIVSRMHPQAYQQWQEALEDLGHGGPFRVLNP